MPLIQCSGCGAAFKVGLDTVGQQVKCPKCKTRFVAQVKRTGPRMKQKSAAPIVWTVGIALLVAVVIMIATLTGGKDTSTTPSPTDDNVAAKSTADRGIGSGAGTSTDARPDPGVARSVVESFMQSVKDGDASALMNWVSFPMMHDQGSETRWSELDSNDRTMARMSLTEQLLGDEASREFLQKSKVVTFEVPEENDQTAKAFLLYRSVVDDKTQQERTVHLSRVGSRWFVTGMEAGAIVDPEAVAAAAKKERKKTTRRRGKERHGVVEKVEFLEETDAALRSQIETLAAKLTDPSLTREASAAKRELVTIGKPAIPALLNLIVGRETMATQEDQQTINQAVQVLRDITYEDMGFAPGGMTGSLVGDGQTAEANDVALRKWFGWWEQHKNSWTGPTEPDDADFDEGP